MHVLVLWLMTFQEVTKPKQQSATITYGEDREIKLLVQGRSGNLVLRPAESTEGLAEVVFQQGSGYVSYDRQEQLLTWVSHKKRSLNHTSRAVERLAPTMKMDLPRHCELDLDLNLTDLGYGSLRFEDLDVKKMRFDVNYGDVDLTFPTENKSIIRDQVLIHLMIGDLEINQLGHLKAADIYINTGIGEVNVDLGPKIWIDTKLKFDHDIGSAEITLPEGTYVVVTGTSRNLEKYGFVQDGKVWKSKSHTSEFPMLTLDLHGPVGDLEIIWKTY